MPLNRLRHREYMLLDIRGKVKEVHYLSYAGAGESLASGYVSLDDAFP